MIRLVRAFHRHADVVGLGLGEGRQVDTELFEVQVLQLITDNPIIPAVRLSEITRFSQSTINRILLQLKAENIVEYVGSKKSGGYRVVGATQEGETAETDQQENAIEKGTVQ